jgi:hypothetical protein
MRQSSLDQEREAPLDELETWGHEEDEDRYSDGIAVPTQTTTVSLSLTI